MFLDDKLGIYGLAGAYLLGWLLQALTEPGDGIVIQPPVYNPFPSVIGANGRTVVENRLLYSEETGWDVDLEGLEDAFRTTGAKVLLLCSPHNPVGRVWNREELETIALGLPGLQVESAQQEGAYTTLTLTGGRGYETTQALFECFSKEKRPLAALDVTKAGLEDVFLELAETEKEPEEQEDKE